MLGHLLSRASQLHLKYNHRRKTHPIMSSCSNPLNSSGVDFNQQKHRQLGNSTTPTSRASTVGGALMLCAWTWTWRKTFWVQKLQVEFQLPRWRKCCFLNLTAGKIDLDDVFFWKAQGIFVAQKKQSLRSKFILHHFWSFHPPTFTLSASSSSSEDSESQSKGVSFRTGQSRWPTLQMPGKNYNSTNNV